MRRIIAAALVVLGLSIISAAQPVYAVDIIKDACNEAGATSAATCQTNQSASEPKNVVEVIISTILYALGIVAVIMIIVGGFRYVLSAGDSAAVTAAKNTIFYAVIGLVIALLSIAIVQFVLNNVS